MNTRSRLVLAGSLLAIAAMPSAAFADGGQIAAGVIGGLAAGALIGGAAAQGGYYAPPPPAYYAPAPVYGYPACQWQRQQFWDGYGWRVRRVQVCY